MDKSPHIGKQDQPRGICVQSARAFDFLAQELGREQAEHRGIVGRGVAAFKTGGLVEHKIEGISHGSLKND
jgi:hypothetical protein